MGCVSADGQRLSGGHEDVLFDVESHQAQKGRDGEKEREKQSGEGEQ